MYKGTTIVAQIGDRRLEDLEDLFVSLGWGVNERYFSNDIPCSVEFVWPKEEPCQFPPDVPYSFGTGILH